MNLFLFHACPELCAKQYPKTYVIKMILEYAQMLCTALYVLEFEAEYPDVAYKPKTLTQAGFEFEEFCSQECGRKPYAPTHLHHPMTIWVRSRRENFAFTSTLALALCKRFLDNSGKQHATQPLLTWIHRTYVVENTFLPFPTCLPNSKDKVYACMPDNMSPLPLCVDETIVSPLQRESEEISAVEIYRNYFLRCKLSVKPSIFNRWYDDACVPDWVQNSEEYKTLIIQVQTSSS